MDSRPSETCSGLYQNKLEKQCISLAFIIRIYHDVRSSECQNLLNIQNVCLRFCLSYPAGKSHLSCAVLYCHLWPVWLSPVFPYYLINGKIYEKNY